MESRWVHNWTLQGGDVEHLYGLQNAKGRGGSLSRSEDSSSRGRVPQNQDSQSRWLRVGLEGDSLILEKEPCRAAFTINEPGRTKWI